MPIPNDVMYEHCGIVLGHALQSALELGGTLQDHVGPAFEAVFGDWVTEYNAQALQTPLTELEADKLEIRAKLKTLGFDY